MADIFVNDAEIIATLNRLLQSVENPRPALLEIAEDLLESTKRRFETSTRPDGVHWAENSWVTTTNKTSDKILIDQGNLQQQLNREIFNDGIDLYNTMEYAAMQQFGGTKEEFPHLWGDIPARPFLGLSDNDRSKLLATLQSHIEDTWR